jgi:acyl-CoA thioester hydrolase
MSRRLEEKSPVKPPSIPVEKVTLLEPVCLRMTIPEAYVDANGHMNIRWYVAIFDDAGDALHDRIGLTREFHRQHASGTMDLEHHISFLSEAMPGDRVAVYARMVAHSAKLAHYLMFMVNERHGTMSALFECVNAFVDLRARKSAPYPVEILRKIDAVVLEHNRLDWPPPLCGAMKV